MFNNQKEADELALQENILSTGPANQTNSLLYSQTLLAAQQMAKDVAPLLPIGKNNPIETAIENSINANGNIGGFRLRLYAKALEPMRYPEKENENHG